MDVLLAKNLLSSVCDVLAKIFDSICSNTSIIKDIKDRPHSAPKKKWFASHTHELIQSIIAVMDLAPDSLSQVK
jgi:hypothetical protein